MVGDKYFKPGSFQISFNMVLDAIQMVVTIPDAFVSARGGVHSKVGNSEAYIRYQNK